MTNLQSNDALKNMIEKAYTQFEKEPWYSDWLSDLLSLFTKVAEADREERSSIAFQQILWINNPVSGLGMGTVSLGGALDDLNFRVWLADASLQPVPSDFEERYRYFQKFYTELLDRLKPFTNRTPRLKIYRVMAALFPNDFTTISAVNKVSYLYNKLFTPNPSANYIRQHMEISQRFREVLGESDNSLLALAKRITLPWLVYEFAEEDKPTNPLFEETVRPGAITLRPFPATQRRKGLTSIKGGLASIHKAISFVGDGVSREDLFEFFRSEFPEYANSSLNTLFNVMKNEFFVLSQEGDKVVLTQNGKSLSEGGETSELIPGLITRILGVDNVLNYLQKNPQKPTKELLDLLKNVNPGWTTSFAPGVLLKWLKDFSLIISDKFGNYSLTEDGVYWAGLIYWQPEFLSIDEDLDSLKTLVTQNIPEINVPTVRDILGIIKDDIVIHDHQVASLHVGLWAHKRRHFAILAGLSGSGKTLLARTYGKALAKASASEQPDNHVFTLAVQPGWYDSSPVFGYVNPLNPDSYVRPALLDFILRAIQNPTQLYTLILDEMNLSHPEQYLAPILSAMESGDSLRFHNQGAMFDGIPDIVPYPQNLCLIGTVNMDETTHGLSDKVLDRAFTMEFWKIDLNSYPNWEREYLNKEEIQLVRNCLLELHNALEPVRLHFGWRTLIDVLDYLDMYRLQLPNRSLSELLDEAIYARVLPKLRGSDGTRMEKALKLTCQVLKQHGLKQSSEKVEGLCVDLNEQGSMRFWR